MRSRLSFLLIKKEATCAWTFWHERKCTYLQHTIKEVLIYVYTYETITTIKESHPYKLFITDKVLIHVGNSSSCPQSSSDLLSVTVRVLYIFRILYKWTHMVCSLFIWFFPINIIILRLINVAVCINSSSLLFLSNIPLYKYMTVSLSSFLLINNLVCSSLKLLQINLLVTLMYSLCMNVCCNFSWVNT